MLLPNPEASGQKEVPLRGTQLRQTCDSAQRGDGAESEGKEIRLIQKYIYIIRTTLKDQQLMVFHFFQEFSTLHLYSVVNSFSFKYLCIHKIFFYLIMKL